MAKLTRVTGKVFGATASTTNTPVEIGQFGSAKAGTYNATNDVATIQNLSAWSNGWIDAVTPTDQFPPLPEMTGVHKVLSYQNAYVLQEGVPEYDAGTTYYENSICKGVNNEGSLVLYKSLVDNNTGNALSDNNYWEELSFGGGSRNIGEIVASTTPLTDAGLHLLDGSKLQYGSYKSFIDYIATLYNSGDYSAIFDTEANWQSAMATYGVCSKFVYDSVNNTVRLPKYGNQIITTNPSITTASTVPVKGNGMTLGLTDGNTGRGTVVASNGTIGWQNGAYGHVVSTTASGNFTYAYGYAGVTTNATKSGIIADTSNLLSITNYSLDCYYYIVIATTTKTDIQVDIDEIATDLNGKADVDLTNLSSTSCTNFDGQWVNSQISLATLGNVVAGTYTSSLSSYLPNDGKNYEVLVNTTLTGNSSELCSIVVTSDIITHNLAVSYSQVFADAGGHGANTFVLPVGSSRTLSYTIITSSPGGGYIRLFGYRRIGTNN